MATRPPVAARPIPPRPPDAPDPLDDPATRAEIRAWTALILSRSGSGTITITLDFHERRYQGLRVGGQAGRKVAKTR